MMNLELGGCEPLFGCFPDWSFFFLRRLSLRGMFRLFTLPTKVQDRARASFSRKPNGLNTTQRDGDFYGNDA